jgi:hypothetical protein
LPEKFWAGHFSQKTNRTNIFSPNHDRWIHRGRFAAFIDKILPDDMTEASNYVHINDNQPLYTMVANVFDLWDYTGVLGKGDRRYLLGRYGAFFTNTQGAKRANKFQNLTGANQRQEANVSLRMMASGLIREVTEASVDGQKCGIFRGPKKYIQMIERIKSFLERIENIRRRALGEEVLRSKRKSLLENLTSTYSKVVVAARKTAFENALEVAHVPLTKERQTGFDIAHLALGKLQFGKNLEKLNKEATKTLELLGMELNGHREEELGRQLTDAEDKEIRCTGITEVKNLIKKDEKRRASKDPEYKVQGQFFKVLFSPLDQYVHSLN